MTEPLSETELAWLARHLAECPACSEIDAAYREQQAALRALPMVSPPRDLWARTAAALDAEDRRRSVHERTDRRPASGRRAALGFAGQRERRAPVLVAVVGLLVVAVTASGTLLWNSLGGPAGTHVAVGSTGPVQPTPIEIVPGTVAWVSRGDNGSIVVNTVRIGRVCPGEARVECDPLAPTSRPIASLRGPPSAVVVSPGGGEVVVVEPVNGNAGGSIVVVLLQETIPPAVSASPVATSVPTLTSGPPIVTPTTAVEPTPPGASPEPSPPPSVEPTPSPASTSPSASFGPSSSPTPTGPPATAVPTPSPTEAPTPPVVSSEPTTPPASGEPTPSSALTPAQDTPEPTPPTPQPTPSSAPTPQPTPTTSSEPSASVTSEPTPPQSVEPTPSPTDQPATAQPSPEPTPSPTGSASPPASTEPTASREPSAAVTPTVAPGTPTPVPAQMTIIEGVIVVGETAAYSPDGRWFAFAARPADGSHGPDVHVWRVGDSAGARAVTSDHRSVFASWAGDRLIVSGPDSDSPAATEEAAPPISRLVDPESGISRRLATETIWSPIVDPTGRFVVYWVGDLRLDAETRTWLPTEGRLYLADWRAIRGNGPQSSWQPIEPALLPGVGTSVQNWIIRWAPRGDHLAVWIGSLPTSSIGGLSLLEVDRETGRLSREPWFLDEEPALSGFAIGVDRIAWVSPGRDGSGRQVLVLAWRGEAAGQIKTDPAGDPIVVIR